MQVWIVRRIVNLYFLGALALSFQHIITTALKLHVTGGQHLAWPFMIDGIAVIGMVMRTDRWSTLTNKIGFKIQLVAGTLSLSANVYAGSTVGDRITGIGAVALFIFSEWASGKMITRAEELKALEIATLEAQATLPSPEELAATKRSEAARKAAATKKRNARIKARDAKALERMLQD